MPSFFLRDLPGTGRLALTSGPKRFDIFEEIFCGLSVLDFSISDLDWNGSELTSVASESGKTVLNEMRFQILTASVAEGGGFMPNPPKQK